MDALSRPTPSACTCAWALTLCRKQSGVLAAASRLHWALFLSHFSSLVGALRLLPSCHEVEAHLTHLLATHTLPSVTTFQVFCPCLQVI